MEQLLREWQRDSSGGRDQLQLNYGDCTMSRLPLIAHKNKKCSLKFDPIFWPKLKKLTSPFSELVIFDAN